MKRHSFLLVLLVFTLPAFAQNTISSSEDARFQAQVQRDTLALKNLLSDDLIYIHSNALTETKTDFMNSVKTGHITYQSMQTEAQRSIRSYGKTGISNGIVHATGLLNGAPFDIRLRYTAVYNKQKGKWRLVSWQSTRIQ